MSKTEVEITDSEVEQQHAEKQTSPIIRPATSWPAQPQRLTVSKQQNIFDWMYDIGLILLPVALLVKIILVIVADELDEYWDASLPDQPSELSRQLILFNEQLVTLFTVLFVTIMSTFVKRYALWKAQRGAYLSELEQLQGSVSLPSTAKLIWSLRSWSRLSLLLLLAWSFYYTGSQAVKNEYRLSDSGYKHNVSVAIPRYDAPSLFQPQIGSLLRNTSYSYTDEMTFNYDDSLRHLNYVFATELYKSDDQNISPSPPPNTNIIPDFDQIPMRKAAFPSLKDRIHRKNEGWIDIRNQAMEYDLLYTSLEPVASTLYLYDDDFWDNTAIIGTDTIANASYLSVNCSDFTVEPFSSFPTMSSNYSVSLNMTSPSVDARKDSQGHVLRDFDLWWGGMLLPYDSNATAFSETLQSYSGSSYNGIPAKQPTALRSTCNITTKHVDIAVECGSSGCLVDRMRWVNNVNETMATSYETPFSSDDFARSFYSNLALSTGPQHYWTDVPEASAICQYVDICGLAAPYVHHAWSQSDGPEDVYDAWSKGIDAPAFQELTIPFNTYYTLSQNVVLPGEINWDDSPSSGSVKNEDEFFFVVVADAAPYLRQYRIYWQWILFDIVANLILLSAAVAACSLRLNTIAPDIFGYVSTLTRDNPDLALPSQASSLDGISRARMLRHVKVRIGEVPAPSGKASAGRIALASADARIDQLRRDCVYV